MADKIRGSLFSMLASLGVGSTGCSISTLERGISESKPYREEPACRFRRPQLGCVAVIRDNLEHTKFPDRAELHYT